MKRMIAIAAVAAFGAGGAYLFMSQNSTVQTPGTVQAASIVEVAQSDIAEMVMGAEDAPVTIVEYASFTCPHCATFHNGTFEQIKKNYVDTGKVRFVYREVYFDRFGLWASMVARCGGETRFFGIADMLYDQQRDWLGTGDPVQIADALRTIGRTAGMTSVQVNECMEDTAKAEALFGWYEANAQRDNIRATPSFVINGENYSNMDYAQFARVLDEKLAN
ncbi:DsbA family protein [Parasulfitobacter algicola]|uniref:DsbA family protein n=1 Tax=Parasulfitobacter algicola TaxID=2614809 RepID=A0ABX2IUA3_9RHOB|nr:DsbA family protein [Sulfitobacter algicola]NSX53773.1 DsbA family protein [Sulfitobacter algicola]